MTVAFESERHDNSVIVTTPSDIYDRLPLTEVQRRNNWQDWDDTITCKVSIGVHGFDVVFVRGST